jgi:CRISPR/Cas system-associated protein endoribonuclease Cas2
MLKSSNTTVPKEGQAIINDQYFMSLVSTIERLVKENEEMKYMIDNLVDENKEMKDKIDKLYSDYDY